MLGENPLLLDCEAPMWGRAGGGGFFVHFSIDFSASWCKVVSCPRAGGGGSIWEVLKEETVPVWVCQASKADDEATTWFVSVLFQASVFFPHLSDDVSLVFGTRKQTPNISGLGRVLNRYMLAMPKDL